MIGRCLVKAMQFDLEVREAEVNTWQSGSLCGQKEQIRQTSVEGQM